MPVTEFKRIGVSQVDAMTLYLHFIGEITDSERELAREVATVAQASRTDAIIAMIELEMEKYKPMSKQAEALSEAIKFIEQVIYKKEPDEEPTEATD